MSKNDQKYFNNLIKDLTVEDNQITSFKTFKLKVDKYIKKEKKVLKNDLKKEIKIGFKDYKKNITKYYKKMDVLDSYNRYITTLDVKEFNKLFKESLKYVDTLFANVDKNLKADYKKALHDVQVLQKSGIYTNKQIKKKLSNDYGKPTMTFKNGKPYPAKSYFDMVVRGMRTRQNLQMAKKIGKQIGTDVYQYTSVANCAERCIPLQNKLVTFGNSTTIRDMSGNVHDVLSLGSYRYGEAGGPLGVFCRHDIYPVTDGLFKL